MHGSTLHWMAAATATAEELFSKLPLELSIPIERRQAIRLSKSSRPCAGNKVMDRGNGLTSAEELPDGVSSWSPKVWPICW
jgi:hypothetical protein